MANTYMPKPANRGPYRSRIAKGEPKLSWWKRPKVPVIIILAILLAAFLFLFWIIGQAAYNQSVPR
jgi:hypothetical protein